MEILNFLYSQLKAMPHKVFVCILPAYFRHLAQAPLGGRQTVGDELEQSGEKSNGAIRTQALCGIASNQPKSDLVRLLIRAKIPQAGYEYRRE